MRDDESEQANCRHVTHRHDGLELEADSPPQGLKLLEKEEGVKGAVLYFPAMR